MLTQEKSTSESINTLKENPDLHLDNLHDMFVHFVTSSPEDHPWTKDKINEVSFTYGILRNLLKEINGEGEERQK